MKVTRKRRLGWARNIWWKPILQGDQWSFGSFANDEWALLNLNAIFEMASQRPAIFIEGIYATVTIYSIDLHQHRFSAWAAARAASVKGRRFNVRSCVRWLEAVGLDESFNLDALPSPHQFNEMHRDLRKRLIEKAMTISQFELSDGQAAKIINCYLKARFINAQTAHLDKVHSIHPPIDRLLLDELIRIADLDGAKKQKLKAAKDRGWSALGADCPSSEHLAQLAA